MNRHIKRKDWIAAALFGFSAIALSAQAASFDCSKAQTKVEHLICGDAELSKLDEKLGQEFQYARRFKVALRGSVNPPPSGGRV